MKTADLEKLKTDVEELLATAYQPKLLNRVLLLIEAHREARNLLLMCWEQWAYISGISTPEYLGKVLREMGMIDEHGNEVQP